MGKKKSKPRKSDVDLTDLLGHGGPIVKLDDLLGYELPPKRQETNISLVLFWTVSHCRCGKLYKGPTYPNQVFLKQRIDKAVRYFGRHHGYKFSHTEFVPIPDVDIYDLPYETDEVHLHIGHCPKCIRRKRVILLGGDNQNDTQETAERSEPDRDIRDTDPLGSFFSS